MLKFIKYPFRQVFNALGKPKLKQFSEPAVFVGGCGRSGTTLLLSVLSAHKDLFCHPKELGVFNGAKISEDGKLKLRNEHRLYQSFVMNPVPKSAVRWCEKSPNNIRHIEHIELLTDNNFQFIQIVRDGRDVILSRHPTAPDRYWVNPDRWIRDVGRGLDYAEDPRVHTVRYEDLITDYEDVINGICEFLKIEVTNELLNWHEHARVTQNRAFFGKVQKISKGSIEKWRNPKHAERIKELTDRPEAIELLKKYGYPLD